MSSQLKTQDKTHTNSLAPIVLFVYNRPEHTLKTLEALSKNEWADQSVLYIFSDGAKEDASGDTLEKIRKAREIVYLKKWCAEVTIIERGENWGLAESIVNGVTQIVNQHGKVIVLEDDIVTNKSFLKYMNSALNFYEDITDVMHIAGYFFPINSNNLPSTFFYNANSCWGWATWKRAWDKYNHNVNFLYKRLREVKGFTQLDYNKGQGREFYYQLKQNVLGKMNTWAVRWHTTIYLNKGYCLHPNKSLVQNIGIDGTGQNSGFFNYKVNSLLDKNFDFEFNTEITEDKQATELVAKYYNQNPLNKIKRIKRWIF